MRQTDGRWNGKRPSLHQKWRSIVWKWLKFNVATRFQNLVNLTAPERICQWDVGKRGGEKNSILLSALDHFSQSPSSGVNSMLIFINKREKRPSDPSPIEKSKEKRKATATVDSRVENKKKYSTLVYHVWICDHRENLHNLVWWQTHRKKVSSAATTTSKWTTMNDRQRREKNVKHVRSDV